MTPNEFDTQRISELILSLPSFSVCTSKRVYDLKSTGKWVMYRYVSHDGSVDAVYSVLLSSILAKGVAGQPLPKLQLSPFGMRSEVYVHDNGWIDTMLGNLNSSYKHQKHQGFTHGTGVLLKGKQMTVFPLNLTPYGMVLQKAKDDINNRMSTQNMIWYNTRLPSLYKSNHTHRNVFLLFFLLFFSFCNSFCSVLYI